MIPKQEMSRGRTICNKKDIPIIVLGICAVIFVVVFCGKQATYRALWTDELYSLTTAEEDIGKMLYLLWHYKPFYFDHPPLYFILLHSVLYWGNSPLLLRSISLVSTIIVIALWSVYLYRHEGSLALSIAFCLLLSLHPTICFQATNVRMYAFFLLITSCAILLLLKIPALPPRRRTPIMIVLSLLLAASIYTSYFGILFVLGVFIIGMVWMFFPSVINQKTTHAGVVVLLSCVFCLFLISPWFPSVFRLLQSDVHRATFPVPRLKQFVDLLVDLGGTPMGLAILVMGWCAFFLFQKQRLEWTLLLISFFIIPLILLTILTPSDRAILLRYIIFGVPLVIVGSVRGWSLLARKVFRKRVFSIAFVTSIILLPTPFNYIHLHNTRFKSVPDWWAAAKIIEMNARSDEIILTGGYLSGEAIVYHLKNPTDYTFVHYVTDIDPFYLYCKDPRVVWYVNAAPLPEAYRKIINRYFPYRVSFEGNQGLGLIEVCAKKPFTLPWGGKSPYYEPIPLEYEVNLRNAR